MESKSASCKTVGEVVKELRRKPFLFNDTTQAEFIMISLQRVLSESRDENELKNKSCALRGHPVISNELVELLDNPSTQEFIRLLTKKSNNKFVRHLFDPKLSPPIQKMVFGTYPTYDDYKEQLSSYKNGETYYQESPLIAHYNCVDKRQRENIDFLLQFDSFMFEEGGTIIGTVEGANGTSKTRTLKQIEGIWTALGNPKETNPLKMNGLDSIQINIPDILMSKVDKPLEIITPELSTNIEEKAREEQKRIESNIKTIEAKNKLNDFMKDTEVIQSELRKEVIKLYKDFAWYYDTSDKAINTFLYKNTKHLNIKDYINEIDNVYNEIDYFNRAIVRHLSTMNKRLSPSINRVIYLKEQFDQKAQPYRNQA